LPDVVLGELLVMRMIDAKNSGNDFND